MNWVKFIEALSQWWWMNCCTHIRASCFGFRNGEKKGLSLLSCSEGRTIDNQLRLTHESTSISPDMAKVCKCGLCTLKLKNFEEVKQWQTCSCGCWKSLMTTLMMEWHLINMKEKKSSWLEERFQFEKWVNSRQLHKTQSRTSSVTRK